MGIKSNNPAVSYFNFFGASGLGAASASAPGRSQLTVPVGVSNPGVWDLYTQGALTLDTGATYDIAASGSDVDVTIHMWGAGGSGGRAGPPAYTGVAGGGGGYVTGSMTLSSGTTYKAVVGNAKGNTVDASPWGEPAASGNPISPPYNGPNPWVPTGYYKMNSGGYSGLFATSVSAPNARLMAAGGGSGGYNDAGNQGAGGGGGGTNGADAGGPLFGPTEPENGEGGTPTAGGAGGTSPHTNGAAGSSLTGGQGGARGGSGAAGGGGGSGWYGGGGGAGQTGTNTDGGGGGGGSAYIHPSITGGSTTAAGIQDAANDSSPYYVSGRAKGGVFSGTDPTMTHPGWPNTMWGAPGIITFVLSD